MTNPILLSPASLSAEARAAEITAIVASAMVRVHGANVPEEHVEKEPV